MKPPESVAKKNKPVTGKLALGTVQFGVPYGVANQHGQPSLKNACDIIKTAFEKGVRIFDTAQGYGESELVLGRCFQKLRISEKVKVISKLHPNLNYYDPMCVQESVFHSLGNLAVPCLFGLMLHRASWLKDWNKGLDVTLRGLREKGLTTYLGVSVYSAQEAHLALSIDEIDMIQAPFNIFDRHMLFDGVLERAFQLKKSVFLRSFFLQGLILMQPEDLPKHLSFARPYLVRLHTFCREHGINKKEFAFKYAWQKTGEATLVTGVETKEQIEENCALLLKNNLEDKIIEDWDSLNYPVSEKLINPSLWA